MEFENKKLAFTENAQGYLRTMAGWGLFLAVLSIIGALGSVLNIFTGFRISVLYGLFNIASVVIQLLAAIGLLTYASKVKNGLDGRDTMLIDGAFKGLMTFFLFSLISILLALTSPLIMWASM